MSLRRGRRLSTIHGGPDFPVKAVWLPQDVSGTGRVPDPLQVSDCARCRARTTWTRRGRQLLPIFGSRLLGLGSTLRQCACHCAARPWRRRSRIPACWQKAAGGRLGPRRVGQTPRKENISASGARFRGTATGDRASRFISGWQFRPRLHPRIPATRHRQHPRD